MTRSLDPFRFLLIAVSGWMNQQQLQHQVSLLSFMHCFRVIAWLTFGAVGLLLLVQRFEPRGTALFFC